MKKNKSKKRKRTSSTCSDEERSAQRNPNLLLTQKPNSCNSLYNYFTSISRVNIPSINKINQPREEGKLTHENGNNLNEENKFTTSEPIIQPIIQQSSSNLKIPNDINDEVRKELMKIMKESHISDQKELDNLVQALQESMDSKKIEPPLIKENRKMSDEELKIAEQLMNNTTIHDPFCKIDKILQVISIPKKTDRSYTDNFEFDEHKFYFEVDEESLADDHSVHIQLYSHEMKPDLPKFSAIINEVHSIEAPERDDKLEKKAKFRVCVPVPVPTESLKKGLNMFCGKIPKWWDGIIVLVSVKLVSIEDMIASVLEREKISSVTNPSDELTISESISTKDPLTLAKINHPAKGINCLHKQCFDLESYLKLCNTSKIWNCPLCNMDLPFHELRIDQFMLNVLENTHGKDLDKIIVNCDGSVSEVSPKKEIQEEIIEID